MGDFVKGNHYLHYHPNIQVGILLHREIDHYTDNHAIVKQSKDRLKEKYRHYAGVLVDVFYDHFLALNFYELYRKDLSSYVNEQYELLNKHKAILPARAQHMLPYMIRGNWLENYQRISGVQRSLKGMSRRTKFDSRMDEAILELQRYHDAFNEEFLLFFPEIEKHAREFKEELLNSHR